MDVARKYYAKLFREYCIADLSRYKVSSITLPVAPTVQEPQVAANPPSRCTAGPSELRFLPSTLSAGRKGRAAVAHGEGGGRRQGAIRVWRARLRSAAGACIIRGVQHLPSIYHLCVQFMMQTDRSLQPLVG